jgi:hypothetical protein
MNIKSLNLGKYFTIINYLTTERVIQEEYNCNGIKDMDKNKNKSCYLILLEDLST